MCCKITATEGPLARVEHSSVFSYDHIVTDKSTVTAWLSERRFFSYRLLSNTNNNQAAVAGILRMEIWNYVRLCKVLVRIRRQNKEQLNSNSTVILSHLQF